jgi:hypothetical protein
VRKLAIIVAALLALGCMPEPGPGTRQVGYANVEAIVVPYGEDGRRICFVAYSRNSGDVGIDCPLDLAR